MALLKSVRDDYPQPHAAPDAVMIRIGFQADSGDVCQVPSIRSEMNDKAILSSIMRERRSGRLLAISMHKPLAHCMPVTMDARHPTGLFLRASRCGAGLSGRLAPFAAARSPTCTMRRSLKQAADNGAVYAVECDFPKHCGRPLRSLPSTMVPAIAKLAINSKLFPQL